jgi:hypothetical protein
LSGRDALDVIPRFSHDSSGVGSGNVRQCEPCARNATADEDVEVVDPRRADFDQDVAWAECGIGSRLVAEDLGAPVFVKANGVHDRVVYG